MSKNAILASLAACLLVLSAIAYGVYINMSGSSHVSAVRRSDDSTVQVAAVGRRDVVPSLRTALQLEPVWNMDIYAAGDGRIEQLLVKQGDMVAEGTLIAVLESRELAAQIKQAQGNLVSTQAGLDQAEFELQKVEMLATKDAISGIQLNAARYKVISSQGQVTSSQGSLEALQAKAGNTSVYAPQAGVITKRYVEPGSMARMGLALVNLADTTRLQTLVPIDSSILAVWQPQTVVTVCIFGVSGDFSATVSAVKNGPGLPAGFMLMELTLDNGQGKLQPGSYSLTEVKGSVITNALVVPEQSLLTRGSQKFVRLFQAGQFTLRPVQTGYSGDGWTMIQAGLQEGELIAVNGQEGLMQ